MEFIGNLIAGFIEAVSNAASNFWQNLNVSQYSFFQIAVDIFLVAILFYWLIQLIRGSRAQNIVIGLVGVTAVFAISRTLNLLALGWLLDRLLTVILVAIPIIFQQELRRGLEKLGKTKFFLANEAKEIDIVCSAIIEACAEMAKQMRGALIVLRGEVSLKEYVDTGVVLHAKISKELLLAVFSPQSPLHDGAVIIDQNKIIAAGCVLPHSFKDYGHNFGTRHKAALGLSEATDAKIFVISEQRGAVACAAEGELEENISPARMQEILTAFFNAKKGSVKTAAVADRIKK